jgi:hypothetical protein
LCQPVEIHRRSAAGQRMIRCHDGDVAVTGQGVRAYPGGRLPDR